MSFPTRDFFTRTRRAASAVLTVLTVLGSMAGSAPARAAAHSNEDAQFTQAAPPRYGDAAPMRDWEMRAGGIVGGLRASLQRLDLPGDVVDQAMAVLGARVDVTHGESEGGRFRIVYRRARHADDVARLLAMEISLQSPQRENGRRYSAVWHALPGTDQGAYFDLAGRPLPGVGVASLNGLDAANGGGGAGAGNDPDGAALQWPVRAKRISSPFGMRNHPVLDAPLHHRGIDLAAPAGAPVRAAASGVVEFAGRRGGYGNLVVIRHASGYTTWYAHLSGFAGTYTGMPVGRGHVVGLVGQTGRATGPHLHFELRLGRQALDPLRVLANRAPVAALRNEPPPDPMRDEEPGAALQGEALASFLRASAPLRSRLDLMRSLQAATM
jgi:hypothetical protein